MPVQAQLPDPTQSPLPEVPPNAFIALLVLGFAIGGVGKLYESRVLIALGMILIVVAAIVLPLVAFLSARGG